MSDQKLTDTQLRDLMIEFLRSKIRNVMDFHQCSWDEAKTLVLERLGQELGIL